MTFENLEHVSKVIESLITAGGIVVGGLWTFRLFVKNRLNQPRADVQHEVAVRHLGAERLLIHVAVKVHNESPILMKITSGKVQLIPMLPPAAGLKQLLESGKGLRESGSGELSWPDTQELDFHWEEEKRHEIEPQESDEFHFDFIAPHSLRTFQIYSYVKNIAKPNKEIGWSVQTIHDVG